MSKKSICAKCKRSKSTVTIREGVCGTCRVEVRRENTPRRSLTWQDVRARRLALLTSTDFIGLDDVPIKLKLGLRGTRQKLRDITDQNTPELAWAELQNLSEEIERCKS